MIHLSGLVLIGLMMTGIGVVLAIGGRPEAIVPLLLGAMALCQAPPIVATIYYDLKRNR